MTPWIAYRGFAVQPIGPRPAEHPTERSDGAHDAATGPLSGQADAQCCVDVSERS